MFYILKIHIEQYQQFNNFTVDLTYPNGPKVGRPLDKVCFIGKNGTGKSTLLYIIEEILNINLQPIGSESVIINNLGRFILKIRCADKNYYFITVRDPRYSEKINIFLDEAVEQIKNFDKILFDNIRTFSHSADREAFYLSSLIDKFIIKDGLIIQNITKIIGERSDKILITIPSESNQNTYKEITDVPNSTVNEALELFDNFPFKHIVSPETIRDFWKTLIFLLKKRENDNNDFRNLEKNQDRTVREVNLEFENLNPKILEKLSDLWNNILEKGGLEFDFQKANNPVQLNENLKAYIKIKSTGANISYNKLSTGIRDYIFKLGHVYALYFGKNIKQGYLMLDEPENSLFPDILYDLVDIYMNIIRNTQLFISTHSPIIAAQFEPNERIILDFTENGNVINKRGVTPIGDDPNDILIKDFGIRSLLGREGIKKWERYIELKTIINRTNDIAEKIPFIEEYMKIGTEYNFVDK